MDFQPASITKTGEASLRAPAAICPALYNATGRAVPRTAATTRPAQYFVAVEAGLRAAANIPVQYNATGEARTSAAVDPRPLPYRASEENRLYVYAGTRGRSVLSASLDVAKAGIKELSRLSAKHPDYLIDASSRMDSPSAGDVPGEVQRLEDG